MKMKRYVAADMRAALRAIREEQGPDAVILSTRQTSQGVEVCAAIDVELAAGPGTMAETAALKQLERAALQELERDAAVAAAQVYRPAGQLVAAAAPVPAAARAAEGSAERSVVEELRSLRNLLEQQLAALAWNDFTRREPLKARVLADLAAAVADGSGSISDLAVSRDQAGVFGPVASTATAWRALDRVSSAHLDRHRAARAAAWAAGAGPDTSGSCTRS